MSGFQVAGGRREGGIEVGNHFDKYGTRNPIARRLTDSFARALQELVGIADPASIHEIGCGEGWWTVGWQAEGRDARGSDFSHEVIGLARANAVARGGNPERFGVASVYDVRAPTDTADLVVCCEVLEHVEDPARALRALAALGARRIILSVPREPLWCALNLARGKYLTSFGNTPGHIQHWSRAGFLRFVAAEFDILEVRSPLPWTMLLCAARGAGA